VLNAAARKRRRPNFTALPAMRCDTPVSFQLRQESRLPRQQ